MTGADRGRMRRADAVLVVASENPGRGMFVELGAALVRAERGALTHLIVIGPVGLDSVFYFHPSVRRVQTVGEWLLDVHVGASPSRH